MVEDAEYHGKHAVRGECRRDVVAEQVWHLLRHPLDTVGSLAHAMARRWWLWQQKHTGLGPDLPPAERAARFWLDWTERCARQSNWWLRVEDAQRCWPEILERLALPPQPCPALSTQLGDTRGAERVSLEMLEPMTAARLVQMASRYGYACAEESP